MKVRECMTREVRLTSPDESISQAARHMAEADAGAIPVGENDRLIGMITDRDIAVRAVARDLGPSTKVRDVMTKQVRYCFEDDDVDDVIHNMGDQKIRRLPVLDREKRLVGIVSLGDVAKGHRPDSTGKALGQISAPGGQHSQTAH